MANAASKCLFLLFLSLLSSCSSGTLVGFSYHASGNTTISSPARTISFLKQNKITPSQIRVFVEDPRVLSTLSSPGVAVDLYLNERQVENMLSSKPSSISWLKTHVIPFLSQVKFKCIIAISGNHHGRKYNLPLLLPTLKSMNSLLNVSVAFPLPFLENLRRGNARDLHKVCDFINGAGSSVIVEAGINGELSMGDKFIQSVTERARLASSVLSCIHVPMVLTVKSPAVPSASEVAEFADKVSKALRKNSEIANRIVGLYAEVDYSIENFAQKELKREEEQIFPSSRRELIKTTSHDQFNSPTIFPTTPPFNPSPNIVTVPSINPVTITPVNPAAPMAVPSTPIIIPPPNPVTSPLPPTNPVTTPTITNPVTTYPAPPGGGVPATTPVTNLVPPPAPTTSNTPAVPGQSWCVAKSGAQETALQAALDYACGVADCSQIQQGGSCYSPITLQNHASYAFNAYYQKKPVSTSCDFGGVATIVTSNPSSGSCVYLSSSSSSTPSSTTPTNPATTSPTPPSPTNTTPAPTIPTPPISTTPPPTITSFPPPAEGVSGGTPPPSVLNSSIPASGTMPELGPYSPPGFNTSTSDSDTLRPSTACIFFVVALVARKVVLNM